MPDTISPGIASLGYSADEQFDESRIADWSCSRRRRPCRFCGRNRSGSSITPCVSSHAQNAFMARSQQLEDRFDAALSQMDNDRRWMGDDARYTPGRCVHLLQDPKPPRDQSRLLCFVRRA